MHIWIICMSGQYACLDNIHVWMLFLHTVLFIWPIYIGQIKSTEYVRTASRRVYYIGHIKSTEYVRTASRRVYYPRLDNIHVWMLFLHAYLYRPNKKHRVFKNSIQTCILSRHAYCPDMHFLIHPIRQ